METMALNELSAIFQIYIRMELQKKKHFISLYLEWIQKFVDYWSLDH